MGFGFEGGEVVKKENFPLTLNRFDMKKFKITGMHYIIFHLKDKKNTFLYRSVGEFNCVEKLKMILFFYLHFYFFSLGFR